MERQVTKQPRKNKKSGSLMKGKKNSVQLFPRKNLTRPK